MPTAIFLPDKGLVECDGRGPCYGRVEESPSSIGQIAR